ncbi:MAG: cytochrome C oxidase subunit IV family protein [Polyangiaceae bacterium]|jgi:cytochrome c oxidase subunit 4
MTIARTDERESKDAHAHVASAQSYWAIFGALVLLTLLTVAVSYADFGKANIVIALFIATLKASLVALFFMHLWHGNAFHTLTFLCAFLFLALFMLLTHDDLGTRGQIDPAYGGTVIPRTGQVAPGGAPESSATANTVETARPTPAR